MRKIFGFFILVVMMLQTFAVYGDGFIVVERPRRHKIRTHFPLAVKYHRVNVTIDDQVAVTKIDQVFFNPNRRQLEGTYIFPMPAGATVKQFSMYMNGKEVQGELLDKDKARKIYTDIVRRMKDPALLEYVGRGIFKARVFPIPARGETRIKLSYSQVLPSEGDLVEYRYPLNTEKFSSKPLEEVAITVDVKSKKPLKTIYSPTHRVDLVRRGPKEAKVGFERKNVKPDKDFKLYFSRSTKDVTMDVISTKPSHRKKGYFLQIITPATELDKKSIIPKDLVFVVDTSGSMMGDKMKQAKKALKYCINSLADFDKFSIVDFSTEARSMSSGLLKASEANKKEALKYIDDMVARGGTNLHEAMMKAFKMEREGKEKGKPSPMMICVITDGEPTVGEINPKKILKDINKANEKLDGRVFVLGIGEQLNAKLLDKIAEKNKGSRTYASEKENLEVKVSNFFNKIAYPALSDVQISFKGQIEVSEIYPKKIQDLFVGTQLKIMGRYKGSGSCAVTLTGYRRGQKVTYVYESRFADKETNEEIPALWANRKIGYLLDQIRLHGEKKELKDEVVRLAKKFGIVTPYTSYLVTEDVRRRPRTTGRRGNFRREKARAFSGGANSPGADEADKKQVAKSLKKDSGKAAVKGSKIIQKQKEESSMEGLNQGYANSKNKSKATMKRVGAKTFYRVKNMWVDGDYDAEDAKNLKKVEVKPFGAKYFELLKKNPEIGKYLSLGQKVLFVYEGTVYEVK